MAKNLIFFKIILRIVRLRLMWEMKWATPALPLLHEQRRGKDKSEKF